MKKAKTQRGPKAAKTIKQGENTYEVSPTGALLGLAEGATSAGWHMIESMLTCPKEHQFRHARHIYRPQAQTPDHFAIGILFHAGRARWFHLGFPALDVVWPEIQKAIREAAVKNNLPVSLRAEQFALRHVQAYISHYTLLPKPKVIAAEYTLGPTPLRKGSTRSLWRTARLDDVSLYPEAGGRLCLGESKTTGSSINDAVKQYTLHGQTMLQALLWRNDPNGEAKHGKIAGIMLDVTVKADSEAEAPKFGRSFIPITDYQLDWFAPTLEGYIEAASHIDRNSNPPRNVNSCTRLIGRARMACDYSDLCRNGVAGSAGYAIEGTTLKEWARAHPEDVAPWL